jgi:uncharacterized protein
MPDLIDPRKAAAQASIFEGTLSLSRLPRLSALLLREASGEVPDGGVSKNDQAHYRLAFGRDQDGRSVVEGKVAAALPLRCQRCNEAYRLDVDAPIRLALVSGIDEANALPEHYDPLLLDDRLMRPAELIEDELILAVPPIPRHPDHQCAPPPVPAAVAGEDSGQGAAPGEKTNPFAVLADLKPRQGDDD